MSPDFSCDIHMAGSEFGIKFMKAWIHLALYQKFKALLDVGVKGLGARVPHRVPTVHHNTKAYLLLLLTVPSPLTL